MAGQVSRRSSSNTLEDSCTREVSATEGREEELGLALEACKTWQVVSRGRATRLENASRAADEAEAFTGLDLTPWINYSLCTYDADVRA